MPEKLATMGLDEVEKAEAEGPLLASGALFESIGEYFDALLWVFPYACFYVFTPP